MQTIRLLFEKTGMVRYISHLDLQRSFKHAINRSDLRAKYTEGFNPHIKMVFALPLSVGVSSTCELVDMKLEDDTPPENIPGILNEVMPSGLKVLTAYTPVTAFKDIASSVYEIDISCPDCDAQAGTKVFDGPVVLLKRTKSGEKECDISTDIRAIDIKQTQDGLFITTELSAGQSYLNPTYIVKALEKFADVTAVRSSIKRVEVLDISGGRFR